MGQSKVNGGSSYPNQGDRDKGGEDSAQGTNIPMSGKSKPPSYPKAVNNKKSYSNPNVETYLA